LLPDTLSTVVALPKYVPPEAKTTSASRRRLLVSAA
jgi:hypothetical protein